MFSLKLLVFCVLAISATAEDYAKYDVALSGKRFELSFSSHKIRERRQAASTSPGPGVSADSATNSGSGGQALPDDSSQPASNGVPSTTTTTPIPTSTTKSTTTATASKAPTVSNPNTTDPFEDADIIHDYHNYYNSQTISNQLNKFWIELASAPRHETLSTGHRVAAVIPLKFDFYFYGHKVTNVTVATGGFIYMSPFLHQWLTATQYIAPLMANFDPSMSPDSGIFYMSTEDKFIVEWKDVMLKDQNDAGKFHFQTILNSTGYIHFVYKNIPMAVSKISTAEHPVKVGLSDAYYNDTYVPQRNIRRRTIYEYHKVQLPMSSVVSGSVIVLRPLGTCNRLNDCQSCLVHEGVDFDCRWCNTINRCSDGLDWYRQHWDREGCQETRLTDAAHCRGPNTTNPTTTSSTERTPASSSTTTTTTRPTTTTSTTTASTPSTTSTTTMALVPSTPATPSSTITTTTTSALPTTTTSNLPTTTTGLRTTPRPPITETTSDRVPGRSSDSVHDKCVDGQCKKSSEFPVAVVVILVLVILALVGGVGAWIFYAYTHPTSKSGMWLMEHRPSQIKAKIKFWKNSSDSGTKYKVESET